jgi:hypothetical protein
LAVGEQVIFSEFLMASDREDEVDIRTLELGQRTSTEEIRFYPFFLIPPFSLVNFVHSHLYSAFLKSTHHSIFLR